MKNLKVSSLFHWLYGAVMFLPILLLPVFMIYSHRHDINSGSIDVPHNEIVDFNQLQVEDVSSSTAYDITYQIDDYNLTIVGTPSNLDTPFNLQSLHEAIEGHVYLYKGGYYNEYLNVTNNYAINRSYLNHDVIFTAAETYTSYWFVSEHLYDVPVNFDTYFNYFDLTQMFGSGNEPTIQQFNQWYQDDYYSYTLSRKELLQSGFDTFDDTDIMSQATYQLYNATDKYFNISQFFGFENLWDYMLLNWFGGNVTIYLRIFWQLLTYWLVVSIAWLIFDLFMYVPKLAHRWLDRSAIE